MARTTLLLAVYCFVEKLEGTYHANLMMYHTPTLVIIKNQTYEH